ncbi:electron transfer flavoprotein subunit beta/FixA family protein [Haloarcula sp. S1CR25-12]|uniref:Electron transfer flavoprotein subunit beta/FixA family protein n=1 Tax=Haloarcula saliterrae TaxID=2950534 RepID=A0ABU2FD65_9EURY|nr:electron transfer flavoprotein subunit beta/FixA family protein [Haloarcula sp. S1CR25-12]MDS0259878.1 electron transfer flavoprotein subunit beta/FixA family protein [Haloarcula sp. S1CR25-12]
MQILVTVTAVSVPDDEFDGGLDERSLPHEWDAQAIEAAVRLREAHDAAEVVIAAIGPEEAVRDALARGPDRAVRVWDDRLADTALDSQTKARLLAGVAAEVDPDLVLTGVRSGGDGFAATGVTLAARLDYGWATVVTDLNADREAGVVSVRRELEGNVEELTTVELPAVLTIQTGCNEPRYASLGAVRAAHRADIDVRSLADLGLSPADIERPLTRTGTSEPDRDGGVTHFEGSPEETATALAAVLREHGVGP